LASPHITFALIGIKLRLTIDLVAVKKTKLPPAASAEEEKEFLDDFDREANLMR
jgi:hypothetical protein